MAFTYIGGAVNGTGGGSTQTVTLNGVTAGHLILVSWCWVNTSPQAQLTITSVKDQSANSYVVPAGANAYISGTWSLQTGLAYILSAPASTNVTVTVTASGGTIPPFVGLYISEYSYTGTCNFDSASVATIATNSFTATNPYQQPTITPTNVGSLLYSVSSPTGSGGVVNYAGGAVTGGGSWFGNTYESANGLNVGDEYWLSSPSGSTSAYQTPLSFSAGTVQAIGFIAAFYTTGAVTALQGGLCAIGCSYPGGT